MDSRVQLKVCEGCGCLWFRAQTQMGVYCLGCEKKLRDFPSVRSRRRPGRQSAPLTKLWAVAEANGGAE